LGRPGDGIFLYPPGRLLLGIGTGIRLKAIRDGIQDYEYAQILKNLNQLSILNTAITPVAGSWTSWTKDPTHWRVPPATGPTPPSASSVSNRMRHIRRFIVYGTWIALLLAREFFPKLIG